MSVLDKLKAIASAPAVDGRPFPGAPRRHAPAVEESDDLTRILALPRRPVPTEEEMKAMAVAMTARLRRERDPNGAPCACARLRPEVVARGQNPCITELRPVQGWYLAEAEKAGGALGFIPVGGGKTGIDILTAMVLLKARELAVIMIPPGLRAQFATDYKVWSQHFMTPNLRGSAMPVYAERPILEVLAYSELSHAKGAVWLKSRRPKLILGDEIQALKDRTSTRTGRFLRYVAEEDPKPMAGYHSGSLTTKGLGDYWHLSGVALKGGSPVPLSPSAAEHWAEVIDPGGEEFFAPDPGPLKKLCRAGESIRKGFHRRLVETLGVISTADAGVDAALRFHVRTPPPMPPEVKAALEEVRTKEQRPDGEELIDAMEVARVAREVAAGFFLHWRYPRGEPDELIHRWFDVRQEYNRELREALKPHRRRDHLDSPLLLREAAVRHHAGYRGDLPTWDCSAWPGWRDVKDLVQPVTDVKWISTWLCEDAAAWGHEKPGIIWVENSAAGHMVSKLGGFPYFGAGDEAAIGIALEKGDRTVVASRRAHGVGRNLQSFCRMLFLQIPADGGAHEQGIGRAHRPGQPADVVDVYYYQHTSEYIDALEKAKEACLYVAETTGMTQKLLAGEWCVKQRPLQVT